MTDGNTKAPTLDELPPQKGSILVLHSIGEDFDGKLVEFLKHDTEQKGKFYVAFAEDDQGKSLRVKAKCCKRPGIRPKKLRIVLDNLANNFDVNTMNTRELEDVEKKLHSFLEKDPCCSPAYAQLSFVYMLKDPSWQNQGKGPFSVPLSENVDAQIKYMRRALATFYGYKEIMRNSETVLINWQGHLNNILTASGRFDSAVRQAKTIESLDGYVGEMNAAFNFGMTTYVIAMKMKSETESQRKKVYSKLMDAVQHFCRALKLLQNENNLLQFAEPVAHRRLAAESKVYIAKIFGALVSGQIIDDVPVRFEELLELWRRLIIVSQSIIEACTTKSGKIVILSEEEKDFWLKATPPLEALIEKGNTPPAQYFAKFPPLIAVDQGYKK